MNTYKNEYYKTRMSKAGGLNAGRCDGAVGTDAAADAEAFNILQANRPSMGRDAEDIAFNVRSVRRFVLPLVALSLPNSELETFRTISHEGAFPTVPRAMMFAIAMAMLGLSDIEVVEAPKSNHPNRVLFTHRGTFALKDMTTFAVMFSQLAVVHEGAYIGWSAAI